MYLRKLELQGFKSFPEYTLIEFDEGMTAVVGPNGSGKSNVTDAIRWVLGEQSVKSLRGGKMEDVIFNGTQSRKAMNYAEVSLTLDNSDRFLDYDYSEIQITRRLYRSGESEYQINHVNCRLKDIVRLFLDTGLGKDGYSIVGQGRVDEVLSTKSEDRRKVIEEASGIVKFKVRKEEAERKLNSTEQNLIRINDILAELEERVGPLKEQARKATEYHKAYDSLKEKDIALLIRRIDDGNNAMGDSSSVKEKLEEEIKTQEDRYLELRNSNTELTEKSEQLDELYEQKRQELSDITEEMHDLNSDRKICEERIRQIDEKLNDSEADKVNLLERKESLKNDYKKFLGQADEILERANESKKATEALIAQRDELDREFKDSARSQDNIRKNIEDKTSELMDTRNRIASAQSQIASYEEKIREITSSRESTSKIKSKLEENLKEADKLWHDMMAMEGEVTSDITTREEKMKDLKQRESKLLEEFEADNRIFLSDKARLKTLTDLEKRKEGYQESVRRLMDYTGSRPELKAGITGILGDLISTDKKYETAIEIALGSSIHNVVTPREKDAAELIRVLKENRLGRVTFLPIENIKARDIDDRALDKAVTKKGYIGVASELVKNDRKLDDIVSNLLGRIIICNEMDDARTIAAAMDHKYRVITLQGDSVNPGGSLTGGSIHKNTTGILGRSREIEDITGNITKVEQRLSVSEAERQQVDEQIGDLQRELDQLAEQLKFYSMERVKAESEYRNISTRIEDIKNNIIDFDKTTGEISSDKLKLEDDLEELRLIAQETEGELDDYRLDISKNDDLTREFTSKIDSIREEISQKQTESERLLAERNGVMQLAEHIKSEVNNNELELKKIEEESQENIKSRKEIIKEIEDFTKKIDKLKNDESLKTVEIQEVGKEKTEIDNQLSSFVTRLTDINDTLNNLRNKYNTLVSKYEKYINDIDFSKNRLWEDYETTYDNVKDKYPPVTNITETTKEITTLKNKIKSLGPVNLNSIDEYKEVSERYEFMSSQRDDIVSAKDDLEKVIAELVSEMKEQFISQFTTINENFKTVFTDLFNGGSAEIILDNEEDVLNCNIEIKAQPPGKKLQNLTLLSGGERCLTAIALLFAILQLRPSPFVVLDEVEAALDDVNVTRFTDFVRRYTARSQFILVTHRKGTMEACDRMYGVTMQERGISKILSMRIQ